MSLNQRRLLIGSAAFLIEGIGWGALFASPSKAGMAIGVALIVLGFVAWRALPEDSTHPPGRHEILK